MFLHSLHRMTSLLHTGQEQASSFAPLNEDDAVATATKRWDEARVIGVELDPDRCRCSFDLI
jgi:hypothetical protein